MGAVTLARTWVRGGAIPPVKVPGAQASDLLCKAFPGLQPALASRRPLGQAWESWRLCLPEPPGEGKPPRMSLTPA